MINRNDIDQKVFDFLKSKFGKNIDMSDSYSYEYRSDKLKINISKRDIINLSDYVSVHLFEVDQENPPKSTFHRNPFTRSFTHTFSQEFSDKIREYIRSKEDELDQDYIRNSTKEISDFIDLMEQD